ncbi:hypothetical protein [Lactobacillus apis]|uniref:hypothetical protein n=1 Tax=Lactobacillus apis TaxID=303541 RepID=UPI00061AE4EF|nr:hypothetical protein [Lactobacillus apis]
MQRNTKKTGSLTTKSGKLGNVSSKRKFQIGGLVVWALWMLDSLFFAHPRMDLCIVITLGVFVFECFIGKPDLYQKFSRKDRRDQRGQRKRR